MRLLLDSADPLSWAEWLPTGLFRGVTTNPTLLRRAAQPCRLDQLAALAAQALEHGVQELHLQAWGADLLACGRALAQLAPGRIWVKLPITRPGAAAARALIAEAIPVTFTACYEPAQVLLAAALGADYIAPYLGRISDQGRDGHAELISMQRIVDTVNKANTVNRANTSAAAQASSLRLLVASLRSPDDLARLASEGLDTFTISPSIAEALFAVEPTLAAADQFERDTAGI
ncbi:MAG: transaldolase [Cyanobacteria bacterium M_surface_10_m2_179]|nr:transaldolase [Cyanobacteria bacterium M_surface_10_m2_179]